MDILKVCIDEIALSGLEGCTLSELCELVGRRQPPITFALDEQTKQFVWSQLLHQRGALVRLYKLPEPRKVVDALRPLGSAQGMEYVHPYAYRVVVDESSSMRVRGSCTTYEQRVDITEAVVGEALSFTSALEKYGTSLVMVASQEVRERALTPEGMDPFLDLSEVQYCVLELIGCARQYSVPRAFITNQFLRIDARSTFHHVKTLAAMGLITIREGRQMKSGRVNSVFNLTLSRFSPTDGLYDDTMSVYESQFCRLLEAAPLKALPVSNLKNTLGKGYKLARRNLLKKGFIERVGVSELTGEEECKGMEQVKGYRLIKPYAANLPSEEGEEGGQKDGEEEDEEDVSDPSSLRPIQFELPLDMQGYRLIEERGAEGMKNPEFISQGLRLHRNLNRQLVKYLLKTSAVSGIVTDISSQRVVRLVASEHLHRNEEYRDLVVENAKIGLEQDVTLYKINNNHSKKKKKKKTATTLGPQPLPAGGGKEDKVAQVSLQQERAGVPSSALGEEKGEPSGAGILPGSAPPPNSIAIPCPSSDVCVASTNPVSSQSSVRVSSHVPSRPNVKQVTSKRLKRFNHIRSYLEGRHIVKGSADLARYLKQFEPASCQVHMKTVISLLRQMEAKGMVSHRDVAVTMGDRTNKCTLYYIPVVTTEEELMAAETNAKEVMKSSMLPRVKLVKKKGRKRKRRRRRRDEDEDEVDGEDEEGLELSEDTNDEKSAAESSEDETARFDISDFTPCPSLAKASKYQRIKHLHYYIWLLINGNEDASDSTGDQEGGSKLPALSKKTLYGLSTTAFPWLEAVSKVTCVRGSGWVSFLDILSRMPLSLFVILVGVYARMVKRKYSHYFNEPPMRNTTLMHLPRGLRKHLCHLRRDKHEVSWLLKQMADMDLIEIDGLITNSKTVAGVYVRLKPEGTILDTSTADPRRSFFLEEARSLFEVAKFPFKCLTDLERFWFELQRVCLNTRIILVDRGTRKQARTSDNDNDSEEDESHYSKDLYPLPYTSLEKLKRKNHRAETEDMLGFGAGGLPPRSFSHLYRNWCQSRTTIALKVSKVQGGGVGLCPTDEGYGPGVGLTQLPSTNMAVERGSGDEDAREGALPEDTTPGALIALQEMVKDLKRVSTPYRFKGPFAKLTVKGTEVLRHHGGRGLKRVEQAKKLEVTRRVKKAKETVARMRTHHSTKHGITGERKPSGHRTRTNWLTQEDTLLMLAYIATKVMTVMGRSGQEVLSPEVDGDSERQCYILPQIMEAHRQEFPGSGKTTAMFHRRLMKMIKDETQAATVDMCVTEVLDDLRAMEPSDRPLSTFSSALQFIKTKYRSQGDSILSACTSLPPTMAELKRNYTITENDKKPLVPMDTDEQINIAHLCDLIIASLGADKASYDEYAAYKLFEHFREADTKAAFDVLKAHNLLRIKRSTYGIPREKGPLKTQSFMLSSIFYNRLEQPCSSAQYNTIAALLKLLHANSWPGDLVRDPVLPSPHPSNQDTTTVDMETMSNRDDDDEEEDRPVVEPEEVQEEAMSEGVTSHLHGVSVGSEGCVKVVTGVVTGSTVTSLVGILFGSRNEDNHVLTCKVTFPKQLLVEKEGLNKPHESNLQNQKKGSEKPHPLGQKPTVEVPREQPMTSLDEEEDDDEDDEQSHDEGEGEGESVKKASTKPGWGLTGFLNVSEVAALRHCSVQLDVAPAIGPLCRPLENEGGAPHPQSICESMDLEAEVKEHLSLKGYLEFCDKELNFSDSDVAFASKVYDVINGCGSKGISLAALLEHKQLVSLVHNLPLDIHITSLINFEMVYKVGVNVEVYITHTHGGRWFMPAEDHHCTTVGYRPWSTIQHHDPNVKMINLYQQGVLSYITAQPGVTMNNIADHFAGMLRLNGLKQILQTLEASGCIRSYSLLPPTSQCTLFSVPQSSYLIGVPLPDTPMDHIFYLPTPAAPLVWAGSLNVVTPPPLQSPVL